MTSGRIAILGGATPAEAAVVVACVELLLAEWAAAASSPDTGRSPWWHEGLAAELHDLPPGPYAPIVTEAG